MKKDKNHTLAPQMSRRNALKYITLSPVTASILAGTTATVSQAKTYDIRSKIVIVGGGAGALTVLSRLLKTIENPNITVISPSETHIYQAGQVLVGAGIMSYEDIFFKNSSYINERKVTWIKDEVSIFNAKNNSVTTRQGEVVGYNYLVIATGVAYHYEQINGLKKEDIGTHGITSVYLNDLEKGTAKGATDTWAWFQQLKKAAQEKKPRVIFTHPNTAIKCAATPQKTLFLAADYLKQYNLSAEFEFISSQENLFPLTQIEVALHKEQSRYGFIKNKLQHHLESIDVQVKKAIFVHTWKEKGHIKSERLELEYDFIHIVPPMSPVKALMQSSLINEDGWLDVDQYTLQHKKYKNIFGIGDTCGIPLGKTAGSVQQQGIVLTQNILNVIQNKRLTSKFDGYTLYPIQTQYGRTLMAELNYKGLESTLPLNSEKPRWMWWIMDLYLSKPIYQHLMLTGKF